MRYTGKTLEPIDFWEYLNKVDNIASNVALNMGAGAKGAYVQLVASSARIYFAWIITIHTIAGAGVADAYVDLATGAGGSEADFIDDLFHEVVAAGNRGLSTYYIPCYQAAGQRISARVGNTAGGSVRVSVWGVGHA